MSSELLLRRKWTLQAHGEQVVSIKKRKERAEHVLIKAFLWGIDLAPFIDLVEQALEGYDRSAPFDLLSFPPTAPSVSLTMRVPFP